MKIMIPKKVSTALLHASAVALVFAVGCTTNIPPDGGKTYLDPKTPDAVLQNLQTAYKNKEIDEYAKLLAEDYLFYFDPDTRATKGLPEFWNRFTDSTGTDKVFKSDEVSDIRIKLTYQKTPQAVDEIGRERWKLIYVTNEQLEVDLKPKPGEQEGVTLLVEGQIQKFYFRQGKTEADTLPESPSSKLYYITEWRDQGKPE